MFNKKGVDAIVATVLIIMITVAAVAILWAFVIPMINTSLTSSTEGKVSLTIETAGGYTTWDEKSSTMNVQVKRGNDNVNLTGIEFIFSIQGKSVTNISETIDRSSTKIYSFDFLTTKPEKIAIAPVTSKGVGETISETSNIKDYVGSSIKVGLGKKCRDNNENCISSFCGGKTDGSDSICTNGITGADPCKIGTSCVDGYCNTFGDGVCSDGADGRGCGSNTDCSNSYCNTLHTCSSKGAGASCGSSIDCSTSLGLVCDSGTCKATSNWYFDKDCDKYGNGTMVALVSRPSFSGCVNTTAQVSTISTTDYNDNDSYCYASSTICSLRVGLQAYYPFNETSGTTFYDYSGLKRNGIIRAPAYVSINQPGKVGTAYTFSGASPNAQLDISNLISVGGLGSSYTISFWAYTYGPSNTRAIMSGATGTNSLSEINFLNNYYLSMLNNTGAYPLSSGTQVFSLNWDMWNIVRSSDNTVKFYKNGVLSGSAQADRGYTFAPTYIGYGASSTKTFGGTLDEVTIWNRNLSLAEISQIYASGSGLSLMP